MKNMTFQMVVTNDRLVVLGLMMKMIKFFVVENGIAHRMFIAATMQLYLSMAMKLKSILNPCKILFMLGIINVSSAQSTLCNF